MNIKGKRIVLRALEAHDMPLLRHWYNDSEIVAGLGDVHFPTSSKQQEEWFAHIQHDDRTVRLGVTDESGRCIGLTGFWNIHWRDRRAEHAVLIGDVAARGKGYGKEVIATCARYAFEEMDLYRLDASILASNEASAASYRACGFKTEGLLRGHALRGGERVDRLLLGLIDDDYRTWAVESGYWES